MPRFFWLILWFLPVLLAPGIASARLIESQVMSLDEHQTLTLATGEKARFTDIVFPDAGLAQSWLAVHLLQHNLSYSPLDEDRYGRLLIMSDAEEAALRDGVAVLFPQDAIPDSWTVAEDAARIAKRGVWADAGFILNPDNAADHLQHFQVVEGTVTHLYHGKTATYLNFGADRHTDFSITISGRARRKIEAKLEGVGEGSHIRVRGALYEEDGSMIHVTRPEQITLFH